MRTEGEVRHIHLSDYSPITDPAEIALCKEIQTAISSKEVLVTDLSQMLQKGKEGKSPTLFQSLGQQYYTQEYVGVISYGNNLVTIGSRFDKNQDKQFFLQHLLEQISHLKLFHHPKLAGESAMVQPFLLLLLFHFIEKAYSNGYFREYRRYQHNDSRFRGTLDMSRHIRLNPMNNGKIAYHTREYTVDNAINLLVLTANQKLEKHPNVHLRSHYQHCLDSFPQVKAILKQIQRDLPYPSLKQQDVIRLLRKTRESITHPIYQNFEPLRRLCRSILGQDSPSFFQEGENQGIGAVFSINGAWEELLRKKIFPGFSTQERSFPILEGGHDCEIDLMYQNQAGELSIFDAKNKPRWANQWKKVFLEPKNKEPKNKPKTWDSELRNDIFQIISYQYITQAKRCGAVFPVQGVDWNKLEYHLYQRKIYENLADFYFIPVVIPSGQIQDQKEFDGLMEESLTCCQKAVYHICEIAEDDARK